MFEREKKALLSLSTDHTVPCVDIFSDRERSLFCFVLDLECSTNTILSDYIKSKPHRLETKKITKDLTSNLQYLHSQNFIFADLQPMNVALHNGKWKLINFGCSHQIGELIDVGRLDPIYSSPEVEKVVEKGKGKSKKMKQRNNLLIPAEFPLDIWNLGLILFELHIGKPFRVLFPHILSLYSNQNRRIEFPSKINNTINDADAISLLWMTLHLDPSKRPSTSHILVYTRFLSLT